MSKIPSKTLSRSGVPEVVDPGKCRGARESQLGQTEAPDERESSPVRDGDPDETGAQAVVQAGDTVPPDDLEGGSTRALFMFERSGTGSGPWEQGYPTSFLVLASTCERVLRLTSG